jgi:peptide/nickel transport system substrate-binding protein
MSDQNRRQFLRNAAGATLGLSGGGLLLDACGAGTSPQGGTSGGKPQPGGTLNLGLTGGASSDTYDPQVAENFTDYFRSSSLFEGLMGSDSAGRATKLLAEELTPNKDATEWTIRVKKGVEFHNGKELTAEDVIYSLQRVVDPKEPKFGSVSLARLDLAHAKKLDKHTVRIPTKAPFAILDQVLSGSIVPGNAYYAIVPVGFDPKTPVGTGPFSYVSFTPNKQTVVAKNKNYWKSGLPYLDKIVMTAYEDEASQVNALISGQEQAINSVSYGSVAQLESSGQTMLISDSGLWVTFVLRTDLAPYNDVNVRQALRLLMDRKQIIEQVYGGHGTLGNDIQGFFSTEYDHSIPQREQDIEQAKFLLKKAGASDAKFELVAAPVAQGTVQAAEVFTQQANAAGVNVSLKKITPDEFFTNINEWPFSISWWLGEPYLVLAGDSSIKGAPFNETHIESPEYTKMFEEAIATPDEAKRKSITHDMQRFEWDQGGYALPLFAPIFDAHHAEVNGLHPTRSGLSLHDYDFSSVWLS